MLIEQIGMFGYKVEWVEMVIDLAEEVGWLAGWRGLKIWVSLIDNCYYAAFGTTYKVQV